MTIVILILSGRSNLVIAQAHFSPEQTADASLSLCDLTISVLSLRGQREIEIMEAADSESRSETRPENHRIKLNVGGKLFETTPFTLQSAGPDSLLAALSHRADDHNADDEDDDQQPIFIDRDPEIFSVLLSILRSNRLPSAAARFSKQDLVEEALYYGIESCLRSAMSPPPLAGIDAALVTTIRPAADGLPTAISAGSDDGSIWIAHGGQISSYHWNLGHVSTVRAHLDNITSLRRVWTEVAAVASLDSPGIHFYNVSGGRHVGSAHWSDPTDPRVYKARVTAIAADADPTYPVFAAFECPHRENCILSVDRTTLNIVSEFGRQSGSSMKVAAATKLVHVSELGLVFASTVSSGAFGYSGYMKLWDPRLEEGVWETSEPGAGSSSSRFGDSFADADVDREELKLYKVCWKSGDVAVADMRMLREDPWVYLEDVRGGEMRSSGEAGVGHLHCYKKQVFVSKDSGLEVWSQIEAEEGGKMYCRNFVDSEVAANRGRIALMEGGGDRLFVSREGMEGVEVWESSELSGAISLL